MENNSTTPPTSEFARSDFLARLVHELRDRLAPIANVVELLRLRSADDERLAPSTLILERQLVSLEHLVQKVSAVERLLRPEAQLALAPLDLRALVEACALEARAEIERRHRRLELRLPSQPVTVNGSAEALRTVLRDLVDNAVHYTQAGGAIRIALDVERDRACLSVADDGCGIAADRLPEIFAPRGSAPGVAADDRGGLGLSLALAARVLELHRGRIDAASAGLDAGSEFRLQLPLRTSREAQRTASAGVRRGRCNVLVVDDSEAVRISIATILGELGQRTRTARDGEEALEIVAHWQPDVVLLDLHLPGLDGYAVARALRARDPDRRTLLILMAGDGVDDAVLRGAREAGIDRCVDKLQTVSLLREILSQSADAPGA